MRSASEAWSFEPFRTGLEFGIRHRRSGWGMGLTIHSCLRNLLPYRAPADRPLAVVHGLAAVARSLPSRQQSIGRGSCIGTALETPTRQHEEREWRY
ncbi:MAG: hypothetical protein WD066_07025 [Planctomycetaceae bacterium]